MKEHCFVCVCACVLFFYSLREIPKTQDIHVKKLETKTQWKLAHKWKSAKEKAPRIENTTTIEKNETNRIVMAEKPT